MKTNPSSRLSFFYRGGLFLFLLTTLIGNGCKVNYSFSGIVIGNAKTIAIPNFVNETGAGPANLSQLISERLREYYQQNSPLKIVTGQADLILEGSITAYTYQPAALSAQQAAQNRFSITVQYRLTSNLDEEQNASGSSSQFVDRPSNFTLTQVESQDIPTIFNLIVQDIFNKTLANW
jgi:hypothetical protein